MPEYARKPMTVTAYQFDGSEQMAIRLYQWYISCKGRATVAPQNHRQLRQMVEDPSVKPAFSYDPVLGLLSITTPNGAIELTPGDMLVQTPEHEFHRMDLENFWAQHEALPA